MRVVILDGKAYYMRDIMKRCKEQQAERKKAIQPPLFELRDDSRPATQKTASDRYANPTLFGD